MKRAPRAQQTPINRRPEQSSVQLTLIDHLHELRTRLFWVILALIAAAAIGCLVQNQIMAAIMHPLGGRKLVYLTPIGGFNFIFKVSVYFGIGLILPIIMYHLFRFLEPVMGRQSSRSVVFYSAASFLLATAGASFAYFGSLPAALNFLTGLNIQNVSAMLTVDSYLSFVVTYVLGFAALFQIPLILMIINTIKPLPPKKLMSFQRYVVLAAFILAAMISPTPDITNQAILAVPIILMYEVGVIIIWAQGRKKGVRRMQPTGPMSPAPQPIIRKRESPEVLHPVRQTVAASPSAPKPIQQPVAIQMRAPRPSGRPVMDIARRPPVLRSQPRSVTPAERSVRSQFRPSTAIRRASIDGIITRPNQQLPQAG